MKKGGSIFIVLCLLAAVLTACASNMGPGSQAGTPAPSSDMTDSSGTETSEPGAAQEYVGIAMPSLANEFLAFLGESLKAAIEAEGMKAELVSADQQIPIQIEQIENMVNMGITTLVVFPVGSSDINATLAKVRQAGVRVVVLGSEAKKGCYDNMIRVDQYSKGAQTARACADWIEQTFPDAAAGSVEVALFVTTSSTVTKTHYEGMKTITELCPKVTVVETYDFPLGETSSKVQESTDLLMGKHPGVKAILTYDGPQALAADEAIMRSTNVDKAFFGIFASDWSEEIGKRIEMSKSDESVLRSTVQYGDGTNGYMIAAIKGELETDADGVFIQPVNIIR